MNDDHDLVAARISGWLSGELDPQAARAVGRIVDRDVEARRLAGGYDRVDAVVRDWYEALPTEPATPVVVPRRAATAVRWWPSAVAAAMLIIVIPASRIDAEQALTRLFDEADERMGDGREERRPIAPTAHWRLRATMIKELPCPRPATPTAPACRGPCS